MGVFLLLGLIAPLSWPETLVMPRELIDFAKANGCTYVAPPASVGGAHVCNSLMGCMTGYPTQFCAFNGDHTPDPRDSGQSTSWEYQNVWTFLSQF